MSEGDDRSPAERHFDAAQDNNDFRRAARMTDNWEKEKHMGHPATMNEKAEVLSRSMERLATEYGQEKKPETSLRVSRVRVELMANPEVAARLYDILMGAAP